MLSLVSPLGHTTVYTYDAFGRVLTVTDPLGHTATNAYDAKGERSALPTGTAAKRSMTTA